MKRDLLSVKTRQVPFVCGLGMKSPSGVWGYAPAMQAGERAPLGLRGLGGLESRARCAEFSVTEIGNRKECLHDYASFPDRQPHRNPVTPNREAIQ